MNTIFLYACFVNLLGFILMGIDKRKAKKYQWRISEKTLWFITIVGGAIGTLFGMQIFHHKTKHRLFQTGVPFLVFLHLALALYLWLS